MDVKLSVISGSPREIKTGSRLHFYHGTHNALCKAVLLGCDSLSAGQTAYAQLRFTEDIAVKQGDRFVVRFYSPVETVGGGVILHTQPKKHRKNKAAEINKTLEIREQAEVSGDITAHILQTIADESPNFTPLDEIKKRTAHISDTVFEETLTELSHQNKITFIGTQHAIDETFREHLAARLTKTLAAYHKANPLLHGIPKEELRSRILPNVKTPLFDLILYVYEGTQVLQILNNRISLATFAVVYSPAQKQIRDNIVNQIKNGGFTPPAPEELLAPWQKKSADFHQIMDALLTDGTLTASEPGIIFATEAVNEAKQMLILMPAPITLAQFRDALNTSRKFALSLLEYFDRIGFTRKEGDARVIK